MTLMCPRNSTQLAAAMRASDESLERTVEEKIAAMRHRPSIFTPEDADVEASVAQRLKLLRANSDDTSLVGADPLTTVAGAASPQLRVPPQRRGSDLDEDRPSALQGVLDDMGISQELERADSLQRHKVPMSSARMRALPRLIRCRGVCRFSATACRRFDRKSTG
jgi:hypothetical protein